MASKAGRNAGIQSLSSSMRPAAASTVCYVCGAQSAECRLRVRPHGKESFFPFLEYHEAPSGVSINKDGTVDACRVCYAFLLQQWYAFEKSRTPIVKRLYWLKRLESCGSPGTNRPDPQMQVSPQMREEMYKLNIRDPAFVDDHFDSPDLLAKTEYIEKKHDDFDAPIDLPKFSVCYCCSQMTSRNAICVVHTSHWSKSESPYFPCILGHTPPSGARSVDNLGRVLMCEPCANYLLQQWQTFEINNTPLHKRKYRLRSTQEKLFVESTSKMVCLTCGVKSNVNNMQLVHSHADLNKGPFFPCLERCIAPKGASLSRDGVAQLCNSCAASLYEQWNAHEVTETPFKNRIYHINNKPVGYTHKLQLKSRKLHKDLEEATTEVCYICSKSVKSLSVHSVNTSAEEEHTMFFPFIRDLERPSKAMAIDSSGKVHVCDDCFNHLKTKWKKSDRNGFDKGFKPIVQENGNIETASCSKMAAVGDIVDTCFICGSNESPSELNDLHCYPSNEEEGIPFFPFLSNPKASHNSEIATTSGVVKACTFCYVNMVIQWDDYENSESLMDHNRWLRPYHMRKFTCFTCSQAADISCRKLLNITKFNGLARLRKPFGAIFIEDGQIVVVCKPCEKSLHKQKKDLMLMGIPESEQLFNVDNKEVKEQVNQLKPSVNENSKIKEKGESVIVIDSDSDSEKDLAARRSHAHLQASVPQSVIQARPSQRPASVGRPVSVGLPTSGTRPGSAGRPQSSENVTATSSMNNGNIYSPVRGMESPYMYFPAPLPLGGGPGLTAKPPPLTVVPASSNKPTRTTATVTPLSQSASTMTVTSGNSSGNNAMSTTRTSSFAAALRKLAKKATDIHDEPACDTSPSAASRNSTPSHSVKSSHIVPPQHMIPTSTPPVVTIAPTQTANHGLDSKREHDHHHHHRRPTSSDRHHMRPPSESSHSSSSHAIHSSLWNNKDSPGAAPHRWDEKPVAQLASKPEDVHRGFHPYRHADELHKVLAPTHMQYDPSSASVLSAGYPYHPAFLPPTHMQFPHLRLDEHYDRYGYPALRPHFIPLSTHPGLPTMPHPSMHHLLGVRHPMDLSLQSSNLQAASLGSHHLLAIDREKMILEHREREKLAEDARRGEREKERERDERESERIRSAAAHDRHRPRSRDEDRHYHSSKEPPPAHLKESHSNHHNHHRVSHHNSDMNVHMAHQHHRIKEEKWSSKPTDYRKEVTEGHSVSPHYRNSIMSQESSSKSEHRNSEERTMREHLLRQERHMAKRLEREREREREREKSNSEHMRKVLRVDIPSSKPPPLISPSKSNQEELLRQKLYDRRTVNHLHQVANQYEYDRLPPNSIEPTTLSNKRVQNNHDSLSRSPHLHNSDSDRTSAPADKVRHSYKPERPNATDYPYDYRKQRNNEFVPQPVNNFTRSWMIPENNVLSKLDLEEKKRQKSRQIGIYFTSDSESDSEEDVEEKKERYRMKMEKISTKSCFPLDRSKDKMNLFSTVGLVTQRKKEALKSQKRLKRRIMLQEDCLPPAKSLKMEEPKGELPSPLPITTSEFECQPDYRSKCHFFGGLSLEVVVPERRKAMDKEQAIILAYRAKRRENELKAKEQNNNVDVSQKKTDQNITVAADATQPVQSNKHECESDGPTSSPPHSTASPVLSNPSPLLQIAPPRDNKDDNGLSNQYQHGKMLHDKIIPSMRHKSNNIMRDIKKEQYDPEPRATLKYGPDMFRHSPSISSTKPKTLAEQFVQEFHQSVLRTTQESLANQKSGQNSVVYHPRAESPKTKRRETVINLSSQQSASSAETTFKKDQEQECSKSEDPGFKWPGLEVLMEAYRKHVNEHNMEKAVLHEQISKLQAQNSELIKIAGQVQSKKQDVEGEHRRLERDQYRQLQELHQLKRSTRECADPRS